MLNDICEEEGEVVSIDMLSSEESPRTVDSFDAWILVDMLHADILKIALVDKERIDQFQSVFDRAQIGTRYLHQIDDDTIASRVYLRSENYERRPNKGVTYQYRFARFLDRKIWDSFDILQINGNLCRGDVGLCERF